MSAAQVYARMVPGLICASSRSARSMPPNGSVERRARRCLRLALYPSRVRSNDVLGSKPRR
jgi:hypothetical protein